MTITSDTMLGAVKAAFLRNLSPAATEQESPEKRITIIVPYSVGGSTGVLARQVADGLTEILGEIVKPNIHPGSKTTLAMTQVTNARPDE